MCSYFTFETQVPKTCRSDNWVSEKQKTKKKKKKSENIDYLHWNMAILKDQMNYIVGVWSVVNQSLRLLG